MAQREFRGVSREAVTNKYRDWVRENGRRIDKVRCQPMRPIPAELQEFEFTAPDRRIENKDNFAMLVEYENG
jgi:hypothetical protein